MNVFRGGNDPALIAEGLSSPDEEARRSAVLCLSSFPLSVVRKYLYAAMGDPSWRVRKEALAVYLASPSALEFAEEVFELLRSPDNAGLRNLAAETLERLGADAVPVLVAHVEDPDADVRKFVIDILGAIGDKSSFPCLIKALNDEDRNVRNSAAEGLGSMRDERAVSTLIEALSLPDVSFRHTILGALAAIGSPFSIQAVTPFLVDPLLKKAVYGCLGAMGGLDAAPLLAEGLAEEGRSIRESAAKAFMEVRGRISRDGDVRAVDSFIAVYAGTPAVDALVDLLDTSDQDLLGAVVGILGIIGDGRAAPAIMRACGDERLLPVCVGALRSMGAVTLPFLEQEFSVADESGKTNILRLCMQVDAPDCVSLVRKGTADQSPQVREAASRCAGRIGLSSLIPDISMLLNDFDPYVREAALESLSMLSSTDPSSVDAVSAALAGSDDPDKRLYAAFLCGALRDQERLSLLLTDEDARVRKAAVQGLSELGGGAALNHLILALTDENPEVRAAAADALGETEGEESFNALLIASRDEDSWVRCSAVRSLGKAGGIRSLPEIEAALTCPDGPVCLAALDALALIEGEESLELIRRAAAGSDGDVVKAAIELLARRDDPWLEQVAESLLKHHHWDVRGTAVRILAERRGAAAVALLTSALERERDELVRNLMVDVLKRFS